MMAFIYSTVTDGSLEGFCVVGFFAGRGRLLFDFFVGKVLDIV
jgi:hypothetical protein